MGSSTRALLWEIWQRHRWTVAAIAALTITGRAVEIAQRGQTHAPPIADLCMMVAFLLVFAIFNYTDSHSRRGLGLFPRRLFTLPASSLQLVSVPTVAAIVAVQSLYLAWTLPLSSNGSASAPFIAVLLGALMVLFLAALWIFERAGTLRLVILGVLASIVFVIGLLPSFPPTPPPWWRSEPALAGAAALSAVAAFLLAWRHIAHARAGDAILLPRFDVLTGRLPQSSVAAQPAFESRTAAQFWFEWRNSGRVLPALVFGVTLLALLPMSWRVHASAGDSFQLLLITLAMPIVLAVPVGIAFSKPTFWSQDLSVPSFLAVRPLSAADYVAIKMRVAATSTAISWAIVLTFLALWLSLWANVDSLSGLAIQVWVLHGQSVAAVLGIATLVIAAGVFVTWRLLIVRLWSGLWGRRPMFIASMASGGLMATAAIIYEVDRFPGWLLDNPARFSAFTWGVAGVVVAKYWLAACSWRGVSPAHMRRYLLIWIAGTATILSLGLVVWGVARLYVAADTEQVRSLIVLLALLAMPLARIGRAPAAWSGNTHR